MKQEQRREKLRKTHDNQMHELTKYVQNVSQQFWATHKKARQSFDRENVLMLTSITSTLQNRVLWKTKKSQALNFGYLPLVRLFKKG